MNYVLGSKGITVFIAESIIVYSSGKMFSLALELVFKWKIHLLILY